MLHMVLVTESVASACRNEGNVLSGSIQQQGLAGLAAHAIVVSDRSDQSGVSCSGDQASLNRQSSSSSRKRDAPGPSLSPEKQGASGMPHEPFTPQILLVGTSP